MNRYAGDNRPPVKPVERIKLKEDNTKRRIILAALFACLGIGAIIYGVVQMLSTPKGWNTIEALSASYKNCAQDFVFQYELGRGETSAPAEYKELQQIYTRLCERAYWLFSADAVPGEDEVGGEELLAHNVCYINGHPGEKITVDETLYQAFAAARRAENRLIYMGPLYNQYDDLFYCQSDEQAMEYDPEKNKEAADDYAQLAKFAADKKSVNIELFPNNQICLNVSKEYQDYISENGRTAYIDFFWMKNAFIIDYLAEGLWDKGYVNGCINSFDGFVRNLDYKDNNKENKFRYNINDYNDKEKTILESAVLEYHGAMSIVSYKSYKRSKNDIRFYYEYDDGTTKNPYVSPDDGKCHTAFSDLLFYAPGNQVGCSDIVLKTVGIWINDEKINHKSTIKDLSAEKIYGVFTRDRVVYTTGDTGDLVDVYADEKGRYSVTAYR